MQSCTPIGVDIGGRHIKAAQLRGRELIAAACIPRMCADQAVDATDLKRLRDAIAGGGFRGKSVVLAVPPGKLLTSILELPPRASGAPVEQLARVELARMHHLDAQSVEVASWDLPSPARVGNRTYVMATACGHDDAEELLKAVEAVGLDVQALDIHASAAVRACQGLLESQPEAGAVLDVGWSMCRLLLLHQGVIVYERNIDRCGIQAWARALSAEAQTDVESAEASLSRDGFPWAMSETSDASAGAGAQEAIKFQLENLAGELRIPLSYLASQYPDARASRLLMIGGGAAVQGLAPFLASRLEMEAQVVGSADMVECGQPPRAQCGPWLAVAIGLAKHHR